jgi:hypothetical protein
MIIKRLFLPCATPAKPVASARPLLPRARDGMLGAKAPGLLQTPCSRQSSLLPWQPHSGPASGGTDGAGIQRIGSLTPGQEGISHLHHLIASAFQVAASSMPVTGNPWCR